MSAPDLISGFPSTGGIVIGVTISGFVYIPWASGQGGIVMGDSAGNLWLLQIGTDGRLSTAQITV